MIHLVFGINLLLNIFNNIYMMTSEEHFDSKYKKYSKIKDLYNVKEFMNNILIITLLYSLIFLTHKFYD